MTSFNNKPQLLTKAEICFRKPNSNFDNCLKGCQWSPDGSCICTNSDDHRLRIFNLPEQFYDASKSIAPIPEAQELQPALELREPQIIYDFCWYPFMNSNDYLTCFLLCCSRDVPIHLWDAYTGTISSSYIAENNVYELVSARSVRFMRNGSKIIAGYEKFLCIFDLSRPGKYGQYVYDLPKGFVSCLDTSDRFVVSGSFTRLIGLYDAHNMENIATLLGHKGGVTHLRLSADGTKLFSGARKDEEILCWDLRNYGSILNIIKRNCPTNQRIYFDIDFDQDILVTPDNFNVKFYSLDQSTNDVKCDIVEDATTSIDQSIGAKENVLHCFNEFHSNETRVNGVSLHPILPLLATTSGQRCLIDLNEKQNGDGDDLIFDYGKNYLNDNNMKFWWFQNKQYLSVNSASIGEYDDRGVDLQTKHSS